MKNSLLFFFFVLCSFVMNAQSEVVVNQNITTNTTWTRNNIYVLSGQNFLYVVNNATLTIEPGTIVKGNPAALVITRGCKIIANGTAEQPIVFTSYKSAGERAAGDWGGLLILGKAKVNVPGGESVIEGGIDPELGKYGGSNDDDNSGSLKYVRVEFAGIAFQPNNETNGITFGAVGNGTTIENVQVSHGGDDAFEWFGGTVNTKQLVAYKTVDDMFDSDFGHTGKHQFILGVSDPNVADVSGSNGFESDNDATGSANTPTTDATFSNVTLIGPKQTTTTSINPNFKRGMHIRRNSQLDVINSIISGFPSAVRLESALCENGYLTANTLKINNNIFSGYDKWIDSTSTQSKSIGDSLKKYNTIVATNQDLKLTDPYGSVVNAMPLSGSPALSGSDFTNANSIFSKVNYRGAFGSDNWTKCWCEFNANNADYSKPINYTASISDFTFIVNNNSVAFSAPIGTNFSYKWEFGNFTTSTLQNPTVTYSALGTYNVVLTVTNERGCTKSITKQVIINSGTKEIAINQDITSNTTWTNDKIYRLTGNACLYVRNNAVLTIEPGTIIKGDPSALIITRGSKLIAQGTEKQPIVFTSAKPVGERNAGDWGGVAILGAAKVNCPGGECTLEGGCDPTLVTYGGQNDNDNSGILAYVRIEYAGIAFQPNNELNSLTLGGVGKGTTIHHIQTSFGGDDAYEWFGGAVDSKYLIAYKTVDDMFDTDFGYTGRNQFSLGISDPNIADVSGSNAFEADNDAQGTLNTPISNGTFCNVTILGPKLSSTTTINSNFKRGAHLRRSTRQDIINSIVSGFPTAFRIESGNSESAYLTTNELILKGNVLAGNSKLMDSTSTNSALIAAKILNDGNKLLNTITDVKFNNTDINTLDLRLQASSSLLSGNNQEVYTDAFFTKVNYTGAFDEKNNWTNCWAEWNSQNADYSISPLNYGNFVADFSFTKQNLSYTFSPTVNNSKYSYLWSFGDGNNATTATPTYTFKANGTYDVQLTITNERGCTETKTQKILVTGTKDIEYFTNILLFPNPSSDYSTLRIFSNKTIDTELSILDIAGKVIFSEQQEIQQGTNEFRLNTSSLSTGMYFVNLKNNSGSNTIKLHIIK